MNFHEYFAELGLNTKETDVYISLYKLGSQAASTIAKHASIERTYTYKTLIKLVNMGIISMTHKNGIKHFFIDDVNKIQKYIQSKQKKYSDMEQNFSTLASQLAQYDTKLSSSIPKIALYDGNDGIANAYNSILTELEKTGYMSIKFFASNLVYSGWNEHPEIKKYSELFFDTLKNNKIHVDAFLWNGVMLMESLGKTIHIEDMKNLPAGNSSIHIFIVGKVLYIMIFKDIPIAIQIASPELAETLHFLFEHVNVVE